MKTLVKVTRRIPYRPSLSYQINYSMGWMIVPLEQKTIYNQQTENVQQRGSVAERL